MNLRTVRILLSLGGFLAYTTPTRAKISKMVESDPIEAANLSHEYVRKEVIRLFDMTGSTISVNGLENIPKDGACLFASNHLSYFDIVALEKVLPKNVGFIAKDSLKKIPGLAGWMTLIRCLFLDRSDMKAGLKTIFSAADILKEGYSMVIFPEGTRCPEGQLGEFKGASLKMAQKAKVPVIPVAITGTSHILEANKGFTIKPAEVTVSFGEPLLINSLPRPEQKDAVNIVKNHIADMIVEALPETKDTKPSKM